MAKYHYDWTNKRAQKCASADCPEPFHSEGMKGDTDVAFADRLRAMEGVIARAAGIDGFDTLPRPFKKKDKALIYKMAAPEED